MTEIGLRAEAKGAAGTPLREPIVDRVVIVGVGLMGGSFGLALIEQNAALEIVGIDSHEVLETAVAAGAIHIAGTGLEQAVETADLVILATPIHTISGLMQEIAPHAADHATVTDLASVKSSIVSEGERLLGERFVGGHPMAGSEQTGINYARSDLYHGAAWALTPYEAAQYSAPRVQMLCKLLRAIGAEPLKMGASEHDRAAALISHLPHLICYAYNQTVESSPEVSSALSLAAGSYRDLTRIIASDPVLWRDVFIENHEFMLEALHAYQDSLTELENVVRTGDPEQVLETIRRAARGGTRA